MTMIKVLPGTPYPLGATWDGEGVNFAVYSEHADQMELCLFDHFNPAKETNRFTMEEVEGNIWHIYLVGEGPGLLYGYRAYGEYDPSRGLRFEPSKLLIDPYAKAVKGEVDWQAPVFSYQVGSPEEDLAKDTQDDAWGIPKGVVINPFFPWGDVRAPRIPWNRTVIYETHVRGLTKNHPDIPEDQRGTYAGVASPTMIKYFQELGVTAIELLPVHDFLDDKHLVDRGLRNYWGYNTTNYFSPTAKYSSSGDTGGQVIEFKTMVKALHKAGIEVILDVVFNHTSEGNHLGPTLSFRGIDNPTYYVLSDDKRYYHDYTGTGNSLNVRHPQVLRLIMDSLRYWVIEMHVDGFRFDLAATLARELHEFDRLSSFFDIIYQDPILSVTKLIAEPWDLGPGGYQVGKFPVLWTEWNSEYRDTVRQYWKSDDGLVSKLGNRLTGSSDLYQGTGKGPYASINFITAHDGFCLTDLVSYNQKHNEANGENNLDGTDNNLSWNCGVEGPTDDPAINELREQQKRNFLATLLLSEGVPMLLGGDELGRTKMGNNNSYCQDNELSWYKWEIDPQNRRLLGFVRGLIRVRREHPVLRRRKYFWGRPIHGSAVRDLIWLRCDGQEMTEQDWNTSWIQCLGLFFSGNLTDEVDIEGKIVTDDSLLLILNANPENISFLLPDWLFKGYWETEIDTTSPTIPAGKGPIRGGEVCPVKGRSLVMLRQKRR